MEDGELQWQPALIFASKKAGITSPNISQLFHHGSSNVKCTGLKHLTMFFNVSPAPLFIPINGR